MRSREQSNPLLVPIGDAAAGVGHGVGKASGKIADSVKGLFRVYDSPLDHRKAPKPYPALPPYSPSPQQSPHLLRQQELQQQQMLRKQQHQMKMQQQWQQQQQYPQGYTQVTTVQTIIGYHPNGYPIYASDVPQQEFGGQSAQLASAGISQIYGAGGMYLQGQGVYSSNPDGSDDKSSLYGAAADTSNALGSMMHTSYADTTRGYGEVNPDDADNEAQRELLQATKALEDLAFDLANQRRFLASQSVEGSLGIDGQPLDTSNVSESILGATYDITSAASLLLRAAAEAQRERVSRNMQTAFENSVPYHPDPQWADGLVSAARHVVATTQHMINTANAVVMGQQPHEALIAAAKATVGATTQLVAAERAKGDINGEAHTKLEHASKALIRAADNLVNEVKMSPMQSPSTQRAESLAGGPYSLTEEKIKQMEHQTKILALENELQRAREELAGMRKQEYQN